MRTLSRPSTFPPAGRIPWLLNLATRLLARILNMPEPLVHNTGVFVFAHVQAVETSVSKTLCPIRLLRQLRNRLRQSAR
ncbi:MAG TPA: hypothetical protein VGZ92_07105 [Bradyrhizobium sp.]|jgi:hypothetical protein|nr:hypothetical protein [Bradyrhizobium sp.]